ncbi:putative bifunctional diguanylate cyclase/phosphodiesterase [Halomonas daqiaonensis]|uniref:cyclic-guanylate-specific phosphodiesterase n=1 Tax=Halomonas daqiaonensis TaxID=650850 RepID=A0A1H7JQM7_9GAMM|nr:EAL domain-containing protein [Halomonas daqiaonensis]SEK76704.1 diguanylate cyclase (GGDEF) domain-containing protein [Halomonas daqiaonensis]
MSFRRRLLLVMLAVVVIAQLVAAGATLRTLQQDTLARGERELGVGLDVTRQLLKERGRQLRDNVAILASDFGFKSAVATQDTDTLISVLANHGDRANADMVLLGDPEGQLLASSHHTPDIPLPFPELWQQAREEGEAVEVVMHEGRPYQFVLMPVRAPGLIGWVGMGFLLDADLAEEIGALTRLETRFVNEEQRDALIADDRYLSRSQLLYDGEEGQAYAVAQQRRSDLLAAYSALRWQLLVIFTLTLLLTAVIAALSARSMARPLTTLVDAARRIGHGERMRDIKVSPNGEIGLLADTLLTMQDDIASRETTLRYQSRHDQLTNLANRHSAVQDIDDAIAQGEAFTLLRLSITDFRTINDTFGYAIGDQVLKVLADRLDRLPPPQIEAYRLSGDEFMLYLAAPAAEPGWLAALQERLTQPIDLEGSPIRLTLAIGEVRYPLHGDNATLLLRRAEIALDMTRRARLEHQCYLEGQDELHLRQLTLVRDLQEAVTQDQLTLVYQPQLDARTGRLSGVEALMRWHHPSLGFIPPDEFISLAEHSGHIHRLTRWMLNKICAQLQTWDRQGCSLVAAINLSAKDVTDIDLPARLRACLAEYGMGPERLRLEVTESAIMQDPEHASRQLEELRRTGLCIAVDDFGTGYSSLAQLKRLPVQELKIDKSFILKLEESADDEIIVRSTIELGHNLGLAIVAEGVETTAARAVLERLGCDTLQGYLISRPLAAEHIVDWATHHQASLPEEQTP